MNHPALFHSILCGTDNSPSGVAALRQAAWLSHPDGALDLVATRAVTGHGPEALDELCEGHDLLAVASEPSAHALIPYVRIPVLLARWCPDGRDVTDRILIAVGEHRGTERAASLAAEIALRHRGTVAVVAAPGHSRGLAHTLAATSRIVMCTAGSTPEILGEAASPEIAVPHAALEAGASLLVVSLGDDAWEAPAAIDLARRTGCSMLAVPPGSVVGTDPAAWADPMRGSAPRATIRT